VGKQLKGARTVKKKLNPYNFFLSELSNGSLDTKKKTSFQNAVADWMKKASNSMRQIQNNGFVATNLTTTTQSNFFILKVKSDSLKIVHQTSHYKWEFELDLVKQTLNLNNQTASKPEWESFLDILIEINKNSQGDNVNIYTVLPEEVE